MKTTINIIIASTLLAVATSATAKSWRINNNAASAPDFANINEAMSSSLVTAGDTLYLDPGTSLTGTQTVNKQVTIVGPGYFRTDTPHAFAYLKDNLSIEVAGTKVEGIIMSNSDIYIAAQHVTIERCKVRDVEVGRNASSSAGRDARYATIRQCYGGSIYGRGSTNDNSAHCKIENCIFLDGGPCVTGLYIPTIRNNYFRGYYNYYATDFITNMESATITNNIMINRRNDGKNRIFSGVSESTITNNVLSCSSETYTTLGENTYLDSNDETEVFALEGLNDQLYQLKDNSPAKGKGTDGGDCGPYGGLTPYVPGGLPNGYPYYTKAIIPAKSKNGKVNVSLKIKMQNE